MSSRVDRFRVANLAAVSFRDAYNLDQLDPVNPYDVSQRHGVRVQFVGISMEGMYHAGATPRILLSSLRPMPRRAFTCLHELGHHEFDHGSTIDSLMEELTNGRHPNEELVDAFAAYLLMPSLGVQRAFHCRNWRIPTATPSQIFTVACEYGVGYTTLITYLQVVLKLLPRNAAIALKRSSPKSIRKKLMEGHEAPALTMLDGNSRCSTVEAEQGDAVLLPPSMTVTGPALSHIGSVQNGELYRCARRGEATIKAPIGISVRVWPKRYIGMAKYRFLEEEDD